MAIFCKWRGPDQGISQNVQGQGCHWAGEKGRQETSWNSARRNAKSCNPLPWQRAGNCLAGERTSFTGASKGQQHPWMYEQDYGQGMQWSSLSPLVSPWLVWPLQIQERQRATGMAVGWSTCSGAGGEWLAQSGEETSDPRVGKGPHRRETRLSTAVHPSRMSNKWDKLKLEQIWWHGRRNLFPMRAAQRGCATVILGGFQDLTG